MKHIEVEMVRYTEGDPESVYTPVKAVEITNNDEALNTPIESPIGLILATNLGPKFTLAIAVEDQNG